MIILDAEGAQHRREGLILLQAFFADETKTSHAYAEQGQCGGSWDRRILHDVAVSIIGEMRYAVVIPRTVCSDFCFEVAFRVPSNFSKIDLNLL